MKLVTYQAAASAPLPSGGAPRGGVISRDGKTVLDLLTAFTGVERRAGRAHTDADLIARYGDGVLGFVQHARVATEAAEDALDAFEKGDESARALPLANAVLLAPIPRPPSMRDGYAFRQHVETARRNRGLDMIPEFDQFPVFYFTNHQAVVGPGDVRVRALHLDKLDFELEAAIVVGEEARDLSPENADRAIFGMTIMNDFSARTLQMEEMKLNLGPAKGKDFATGLGPWLVTMDELASKTTTGPKGAAFDLEMRAFVNGERLSLGNVKDMTWTFAEIVARASYGVTLYPGDVIGSGTCGTGCLLELNGSKVTQNLWLKAGDEVALEIDLLGRLENRIVLADP